MPHVSSPYVPSRVRPRPRTPLIHGTPAGYRTHNCHCQPCLDAVAKANALYLLRHQRSNVPAIGSIRRILSLGSVGYSQQDIAEAAGITDKTVGRLALSRQTVVHRDTHNAIAQAFDRLAAQPPPVLHPVWRRGFGPAQLAIVVATAKAAGGVHPMLWDDDALDDPDGEPIVDEVSRKRRIDMEALLEAIAEGGVTAKSMAQRFGVQSDSLYVALRREGYHGPADRLAHLSGNNPQPRLSRGA